MWGHCVMTVTSDGSKINAKSPQFKSFAAYLAVDPEDLPEGRYEYWDGELVPVMAESGWNDLLANYLLVLLLNAGISLPLLRPHSCEVEVPGLPRTRFPDLTILDEVHIPLIARRNLITREMPPPRLLVEVVSPGNENSENYKRDYQVKCGQYAAIEVPEYWLIDPERSVVLVGTLADGCYQFQTFRGSEAIVSPTFPTLGLTAEQILRPQ
jgi:Uma2 family endonuclease